MQYKIYIDLLKVIVAFDNTPVPVGSGHRLLVDLRERALQDLDEYYNSNSFYLLSKPDFTATNITDDTLLNISLMELSEKETMKALSEYTLLKQFIKVFTDNIPDMEKDYYNFKKNCALISLSRLKKRDELSVHDEPSTAAKEDRYSLIANMP